jgi:hypothetical protein
VHPILSPVLLAAPVAAVDGIRATTGLDQLEIGSHAFTLRLGTAARHTFALSSLRPRCVPADVRDVRGFVLTLVNLAARSGNRGCSGLDALLCDDVGWSRGCVMGACVRGLDALIGGLESAFDELEGSDFDFALLTGSAPLVDRDGDGIADALGSEATATGPPSAPGGPGLWSGQLRARAGSDTIYGSWTAERAP